MHYTTLGRTGLRVSRLCLGCMTYGIPQPGQHQWTLDEETSRPFFRQALEAGINFFDTANGYSSGTSEEITGRALKDFARRDSGDRDQGVGSVAQRAQHRRPFTQGAVAGG